MNEMIQDTALYVAGAIAVLPMADIALGYFIARSQMKKGLGRYWIEESFRSRMSYHTEFLSRPGRRLAYWQYEK